ncbi:MAG: bifunctional glutamate N-acetyltransferase/amino-acid acetyltransferase ArgJ [Lachnospiraceae bacterium]|nr:bifunctional glutamate N-acetyltransferase/amino-acid acetyltransferase ArgJ [Lachnospiraceae bacterium]
MKKINGGVCAAKGFKASGVHCGIRPNHTKSDLALIVSDVSCTAAGVYTTNKVYGAPITVNRLHLADGKAQAIITNSGNANTCAPGGVQLAKDVCAMTAAELGLATEDILINSTGVIGQAMSLDPFRRGIPEAVKALAYGEKASSSAATAIMTTDTYNKQQAVEFELSGVTCHLGAIAKGSGMINPNMATMLLFITTDAAISSEMLSKALSEDVKGTFNQISVDGDTSTNDTVLIMANGLAGNPEITEENADYEVFKEALHTVSVALCRDLAGDGEGATKLIECVVSGAPTLEIARKVSKTVIQSDLLKSAMFGEDANWGRILCAIGYTEGDFNVEKTNVTLESAAGSVWVCENAAHHLFSEELAAKVLAEKEIRILVDLQDGTESAAAWGCDLTYDYVKINGDYRT